MKATLRKGCSAFYEVMGTWVPCKVESVSNGLITASVSRCIPGLNYQIGEPLVSTLKFNRIFPALAVDPGSMYIHGYDVIED